MERWTFTYEPGVPRQLQARIYAEAEKARDLVDSRLPEPKLLPIDLAVRIRIDAFEEDGSLVQAASKLDKKVPTQRGRVDVIYKKADAETIGIGLIEVKALQLGKTLPRSTSLGLGRYVIDLRGDEKLAALNVFNDGDAYRKDALQIQLEWFAVACAHELEQQSLAQILANEKPLWRPYTADGRIAAGFRERFEKLMYTRRTR